jgi:hypothetical protein
MTRCSRLISLCLLAASCLPAREAATVAAPAVFDGGRVVVYRVTVRARQATMTGLMMVKRVGEEWRGSLVNEFGVKAFDFVATGRGCRLRNTIAFLDKWYIRRPLASDLAFLCGTGAGRGKCLERDSSGGFVLRNTRRGIVYSFLPVQQDDAGKGSREAPASFCTRPKSFCTRPKSFWDGPKSFCARPKSFWDGPKSFCTCPKSFRDGPEWNFDAPERDSYSLV